MFYFSIGWSTGAHDILRFFDADSAASYTSDSGSGSTQTLNFKSPKSL